MSLAVSMMLIGVVAGDTGEVASAGSVSLGLDVSGVGAGTGGVSIGSVPISLAVSGVSAVTRTSVGSVPLSVAVSGAGSGGGGGGLLKTLTVVNTSGGTTPVNSHTPTVGLLFKKGDITSGGYPILKTAGGTTVPYTYWNKSTWSDGSLKFLGVLPRFTDAITGGASASLQVYGGGVAQTPSSRTLAEVYAANITVVGTTGINNISGTWTCDLQSANVVETVVFGDGPAGKIWRLLCNFKQSGSDHGQLVTYYYVMALQDASGNLAGIRVLPRVTQPWYNHDTPAKNYRSFTSLTMQYGAGPSTFDPMANSYSAKTFTWSGSGNLINSTGYGYQGGVAVRLTTTGTLPTGLATGTTYWVFEQGSNQLLFVDGSAVGNINNGVNQIVVTGAGSGIHTMTPIPYVCHFCSYWIATTDGKYVYVQGGGSVASEATLRVQADKTYDHTTRVLPPYDMSIGTVANNAAYNWAPYCVGALTLFVGTTGEREDIGILNSFHVRHFYTQAAVDERVTRIIGLAQGMLSSCIRDHTTRNVVNLSANTYSGMPASGATTIEYRPSGPTVAGFTAPAGPAGYAGAWWTQCFSSIDESHQTQYSAYPYIVTGEPQYNDLLLEVAGIANIMFSPVDRNFTVSAVDYTGIGPGGKDSYRTGAWAYRDIIWAATLSPDSNADLSASTTYLRALAAQQSIYMVAWNTLQSAWWLANGFWAPQLNTNGRASWQIGYTWFVMSLHAESMEDANALAMSTQLSKWPPFVRALTGNAWALGTYYERSSSATATNGTPYINTDVQWGPFGDSTGGLSWSTTGNTFTWTTPNFTPANNDKVIFWNNELPGGFVFSTPYFAVNVSGNTFKLSTTLGGAAVTVTSNGSLASTANIVILPANPPSTNYSGGGAGTAAYGANQLGNVNWALASGITTTGLSAASTDLTTRQSGVNYTTDPKYAMQTTY